MQRGIDDLEMSEQSDDITCIPLDRVLWHFRNHVLAKISCWATIPMARLYRSSKLRRQIEESKPLVLILQMGKVGSTSILSHIRNARLDCNLLHAHYLDAQKTLKEHGDPVGSALFFPTAADLGLLMPAIRERIANGRPLKIITAVRNPLIRFKSAFLQNIESHLVGKHAYGLRWPAPVRLTDEQLSDMLRKFELDFQMEWFERELEPLTGINVYSRRFPSERGFDIFESSSTSVFLYQFEKLADLHVTAALNQWLGVTPQERRLPRVNESPARLMATRIQLSRIGLSPETEAKIRSSRLMRHFYE